MPRIIVPRNVPAFASMDTLVNASVQEVWNVLSELEKWPEWNESVTSMKVKGPLAVGTEFIWVAGGMKIKSRIEEVEAPHRIAWSGVTMGIRAMHLWKFTSAETMTKVHTEESFQGFIVRLFAKRMNRELKNALTQGLAALKKEAEKRRITTQT